MAKEELPEQSGPLLRAARPSHRIPSFQVAEDLEDRREKGAGPPSTLTRKPQRAQTEYGREAWEAEDPEERREEGAGAGPPPSALTRQHRRAHTDYVREAWEARELERQEEVSSVSGGVAGVRSWFNKSEDGHPCPGLERFAAVTNCLRALEEGQGSSGLPPEISALVRSFCFELTFRQRIPPKPPFWALPREELVRIGTQAGLFDGLAETLAFLHQTYAANPERRTVMEEARKFYLKALSCMQAHGTARKAWAEGPSEIQWWEMLHQIRALVAHEASAPEELAGVDESTPLEEVEARIMRKIDSLFVVADADDITKKDSVSSQGTVSTSTSSSGTQDGAALAYWTDLLQKCPVLRAGLNAGRVGPRILTAANWTYSKNVLFELLAQADELELWGPSDQCLLEQCTTRAHDRDGLGGPRTQPGAPVPTHLDGPQPTHLSYYHADGPRVALSERVLLAEQERARKGLLQTVVHSREYEMQLSLWTPRKQHCREVHAQLLRALKASAFRGGQANERPRRHPGGYTSEPPKLDSRLPPRAETATGGPRPFRSEPPSSEPPSSEFRTL